MRIKTILIAILVVLVVLLGGATIYVMSIDYNQYKGLIASEVERATGRKLTIDGKVALALSLTPTLTVKVPPDWDRMELPMVYVPVQTGTVLAVPLPTTGSKILEELPCAVVSTEPV